MVDWVAHVVANRRMTHQSQQGPRSIVEMGGGGGHH